MDTNILSTFARVGEPELLFDLFKRSELALTPAVLEELNEALAHGCVWLEHVTRLLAQGRLEVVVAATVKSKLGRRCQPRWVSGRPRASPFARLGTGPS